MRSPSTRRDAFTTRMFIPRIELLMTNDQISATNRNESNESVHMHYRVYGQRLCSNFALPQVRSESFDETDIAFRLVRESSRFDFSIEDVISETRHETNVGGDLVVFTFEDHILLRFEGRCDYLVKRTGRAVSCYANPNLGPGWIRSIYYGMVLAFCLHLMGKGNLHASAFVTEFGVIGLMAAAGSGKSTLAATFGARGLPLLTDDVLAIDETSVGFMANSGLPHVSLSPLSVSGIFGTNGNRPSGFLNGDKLRLDVDGKWATTAVGKSELNRLIVLSRVPEGADISIVRIPEIEATRIVAENSLCLEFLPQEELSRHLAFASRIARSVPVWRMSYPSGFDRIPEIQDAVLAITD